MALDRPCRRYLFGADGLENRGRSTRIHYLVRRYRRFRGLDKTGFSRVKQYCGVLYRRYVYGCGADAVRRHYGVGALGAFQ